MTNFLHAALKAVGMTAVVFAVVIAVTKVSVLIVRKKEA